MKRRELYAWAAGFIEGDGSISICRRAAVATNYNLRLQVSQGIVVPLERLRGLFGGTVARAGYSQNGSPRFLWYCDSNKAMDALKKMLPFLCCRRDEATLAIRFQNNVNLWVTRMRVGKKYGTGRLPARVVMQRDGWIAEMKAMHRRSGRLLAGAETKPSEPRLAVSDSPCSGDQVNPERTAETTVPIPA